MAANMDNILIIGAKSELAQQIARRYASKGYGLYLCGRGIDSLSQFSDSLIENFGIEVTLLELDINEFDTHQSFIESLKEIPAGVICAVGNYPNQIEAQIKPKVLVQCIHTNYAGPASLLNLLSNKMKKIKKGFIVGISSISGERGRKKNYIYGSAKCAFTSFLSGLRNELFDYNIHVSTIILGFIKNKEKQSGMKKVLSVDPNIAAEKIFEAQQKNRDVVFIMWPWKYILIIIKLIPEFIFKRLNLK